VTQQQTFVGAAGQLVRAQLATGVRGLPGVQRGVSGLFTVASVVLGDGGRGPGVSALGTTPADRLLFFCTLWVILQLLLLLEDGVLSPPLDAVDVEAGVAGVTAPDGVCPLNRGNAY